MVAEHDGDDMMAVCIPEAELTLIPRHHTNEIAKTYRKCILTEELFPGRRKYGSTKQMAKSDVLDIGVSAHMQ